ncbi:MAG: ATP-binding protein [Enterocloster sp.]
MKQDYKMWFVFALNIIVITLFTFVLSGFLVFSFMRPSIPPEQYKNVWLPVFTFIAAGFVASTFLTLWVSKHLFKPIEQLCDALMKVASGDFSVRLPEENTSSPQIQQMNRNFNKMAGELNSVEMLQSDFIQNVSHEIKTPLAAIEGYTVLLSKSSLSEEHQEYTRKIMESTRRLSSLTSSVLQLSRLEKQEIISEKESFSLDEQIREAFLSLEPLWNKKGIDFEINLQSVYYYGNTSLIYQIWINLFSNAIKFTPEGGSIYVAMSENNDGISVRIRDTGIGMTKDVQKHIFEKFYQGEKSRHIEGNGLGLALVKKITDLCGGTIQVESRPGCGSTFIVRLPRSKM